jgi:hypothetical protein
MSGRTLYISVCVLTSSLHPQPQTFLLEGIAAVHAVSWRFGLYVPYLHTIDRVSSLSVHPACSSIVLSW